MEEVLLVEVTVAMADVGVVRFAKVLRKLRFVPGELVKQLAQLATWRLTDGSRALRAVLGLLSSNQ